MKTLFIVCLLFASQAKAEVICDVELCNKLERLTLNPWSMLKDNFGESCFTAKIPKEDAVEGKVLASESRWYQGSVINPTKKSVTRVKKVIACNG